MINFEIVGKILSRGSLILLIAFLVFSFFGTSKMFEKLIDFCFTGRFVSDFLEVLRFLQILLSVTVSQSQK